MKGNTTMWTWEFWSAALTRSLRTFAQTLLSLWGATAFNIFTADLKSAMGVSLGAAVLSLLMSMDRSSPHPGTGMTPAMPEPAPQPPPPPPTTVVEFVDSTPPAGVYGCGDSIR